MLDLTLIELAQCALVLVLGFLPLAIVHWADPTMKLNAGRFARRLPRPDWTPTGVIAIVTHWIADLLS